MDLDMYCTVLGDYRALQVHGSLHTDQLSTEVSNLVTRFSVQNPVTSNNPMQPIKILFNQIKNIMDLAAAVQASYTPE